MANTKKPTLSNDEAKQMQEFIDSAKNKLLSPSDRAKLLEYNSKLKEYKNITKVINDNLKIANDLSKTIDRSKFATDVSEKVKSNAQAEIKKQINDEIKNVESKINDKLKIMGLDAVDVNKQITKLSNFMQGDMALKPPTQVTDLLNAAGSLKYATLGTTFGMVLPKLPAIPKLPSWKSLKAMVKFPKIGNPIKKFKNGSRKLGKIKKIGSSLPTTVPELKSVGDAISKAKDLTIKFPELTGLVDKMKQVQGELEGGGDILQSFTDVVTSANDKLNSSKQIVSESNIDPTISNSIIKYKKSLM